MKGQGSLSKLEALKAEHREEFKAKAPKVKRIDTRCFRLRCKTAINPRRLKYTGGTLHLIGGTCTNKRCLREALEEYKRMLNQTRARRRDKNRPTTAEIWWDVVKEKRDELRRRLK